VQYAARPWRFGRRVRTSAYVSTFVVAVLATASVAAPALGDASASLILEWSAPPQCRDHEEMIRQVRQIAGPSAAASGAIRAGVVIRATPTGFRADIDLATSAETNHRTLEGRSCDELSDAVALVVALAINPDAAVASAPPPPSEAPQALASAAPEPLVLAPAPPSSLLPSIVNDAPAQSPAAPVLPQEGFTQRTVSFRCTCTPDRRDRGVNGNPRDPAFPILFGFLSPVSVARTALLGQTAFTGTGSTRPRS
jgi:hypothetical protein